MPGMPGIRKFRLFLGAALLPFATSEAQDIVTYDFTGHRAKIINHADLDVRMWDPADNPDDVVWLSTYDGRLWGSDVDNFAAVWLDETRAAELTEPWTCYHAPIDEVVQFPSRSRVMGRTPLFGWDGLAHLVVDIFPDGDTQWPHFWPSVRTGEHIFGFSIDPESHFAAETDRPGQRSVESVDDWLHFRFIPERGTVERHLWLYTREVEHASSNDGAESHDVGNSNGVRETEVAKAVEQRWIYVVHQQDSALLIFSFRIRARNDLHMHLPEAPWELVRVYGDVERIVHTPFRDHTDLGHWPEGKVIYGNKAAMQGLRQQWKIAVYFL